MDEILSLDIDKMTDFSFECSCGKKHSVDIHKIIVGNDLLDEIAKLAAGYGKKVFLVSDSNTYIAYGEKVEHKLKESGFDLKSYVFQPKGMLVPDEKAIGRFLVEIDSSTQLIIAVGSGTINDMSRMISCKTHIPYAIVCTAPSMDGYASVVSPLIINHYKVTYPGVYPEAIIVDTEVIKSAPIEMVHAGFGDIIGKYTALTDWVLSREINGEYYCKTCVKMVRNAMKKCIEHIDGVARRDETAIKYIIEALILSGIAIGLAGNSRPASGSEHHFSHYWEIDALKNNRQHPLHGNSVGAATVVVASIYELMKDKIPIACKPPKPEEIAKLLRQVGASSYPKELGISRELFKESVIHAREVRPRYTILQYAAELGMLENMAETITQRFYD